MTQKFEREIEEILRNLDEFVPEESLPTRVTGKVRSWRSRFPSLPNPGDFRRFFTVQWLMVASISLVMIGFLLGIFSRPLAAYVNLFGFALMVLAIVMAVTRFGRPRQQRVWRGDVIEYSSHHDWWQALRRRWRLWWRGRR